MFHRAVGLVTCCLLLSWGVLGAPRKAVPPPACYFPSTVGDKLVYEEKVGDQSWDYVVEVTEARQKGAALIVSVRSASLDNGTHALYGFEVSDKGVFMVATGDVVLESPQCALPLPIQKGATWETNWTLDGETFTMKSTIADEEEVEVPAGKFRCVRIESKYVIKGVSYTGTVWDAPRCWTVKGVLVGSDNVGAEFRRTKVLKSFTPGGK
jgi:hypothetical protein